MEGGETGHYFEGLVKKTEAEIDNLYYKCPPPTHRFSKLPTAMDGQRENRKSAIDNYGILYNFCLSKTGWTSKYPPCPSSSYTPEQLLQKDTFKKV